MLLQSHPDRLHESVTGLTARLLRLPKGPCVIIRLRTTASIQFRAFKPEGYRSTVRLLTTPSRRPSSSTCRARTPATDDATSPVILPQRVGGAGPRVRLREGAGRSSERTGCSDGPALRRRSWGVRRADRNNECRALSEISGQGEVDGWAVRTAKRGGRKGSLFSGRRES
ncbi:uncharacterized protein A4U43_C02F6160 [Asparagus officinalis]|uniref:Uncharacterized protein n=1 Tax=Asparagus officinalis TaxID=4686 RepID=A0A5P1FH22_ASPOF|nr:uncharacterized protein A4U43_C02F6160 [Asparagus officinalis]